MANKHSPTEIKLHPQDLAALGAAWSRPLNALSPLPRLAPGSVPVPANPSLFNADGRLRAEAHDLLSILADPAAVSGLAAIIGQGVLDLIVYHGGAERSAALVNAEQNLWLYSPAPIPAVLAALEQEMCVPAGGLQQIDLTIPIMEAFLLWALLDIVRRRPVEDKSARITVGALYEALDRPLIGMENLAAYYRDCLLLPLPGEQELHQACLSLAEKEWIGKIGKDYLAGETLLVFATALEQIHWHVLLRAGRMLEDGQPVAIQVRLLQSTQGLGLAWYEADDQVYIFSLDRAGLLNLAHTVLADPGMFFRSTLLQPGAY